MACSRLLRAGPSALRPRAEGVGSAGGCSDGFLCMSRTRLGPVWSSSWQELWVIVVPVMDGSHLPLAGRVGLPLARWPAPWLRLLCGSGSPARGAWTVGSPPSGPALPFLPALTYRWASATTACLHRNAARSRFRSRRGRHSYGCHDPNIGLHPNGGAPGTRRLPAGGGALRPPLPPLPPLRAGR